MDKILKITIIAFAWAFSLGRLTSTDIGVGVAEVALFAAFFALLAMDGRLFDRAVKPGRGALIFGCFTSLILTVGDLIYKGHYLTGLAKHPVFYVVFFAALAHFAGTCGLYLAERLVSWAKDNSDALNGIKLTRVHAVIFVAITLILYTVCFLTYMPGTMAYDYGPAYYEATGVSTFSNHHPVLYTLTWKVFTTIADITGHKFLANILYSLVQIIVVTAVSLYILHWMYRRGVPSAVVVAAGLFFALLPTFQLFSFAPTKDIYFGCALVFFGTGIVDAVNGDKGMVRTFVGGLLSCFLRNNMVYVLIVFVIIFFIMRFANGRKIALMILPIIAAGLILPGVVYPAIGIRDTESAEYISVPLQQISALYSHDGYYSEEEKAQIREFIPQVEDYNYRFADPVKQTFNNDLYATNSGDFWKLYLSGLKKNPHIYLSAFLDMNVPLWYPGSEANDPYAGVRYIEAPRYEGAEDLYTHGLFDMIRPFYDSLTDGTSFMFELPLLRNYMSLSFPFWSLFAAIVLAAVRRRKDLSLIPIILMLLIGTYLLGPVSNYRYMYPIYLAFPAYFGVAVFGGETRRNG